MMNLILWLVFGALVGWLASVGMQTNARPGLLRNIVAGIVGAFLGGYLFTLVGLGGSTINNRDFSLGALFVSFCGAVVLLVIVSLIQRSTVRSH
jgi:uncharacterized membrane protein YeaQ/YmgE (transglycosylase-associated protein family)